MDEIFFSAKTPSLNESYKLPISASTTPEEVANFLGFLHKHVEEQIYEVLSIDRAKVRAYAEKVAKGSGVKGIFQTFSVLKPGEIKNALQHACREEKLIPIAQVAFLRAVLEKFGAPAFPISSGKFSPGKADSENEIIFTGKFKEWVAIKKLSIDADTTPQEIAGVLSSINATLVRKYFDFHGADAFALQELAEKATKGKGRGHGALLKTFQNLEIPTEHQSCFLHFLFKNLGYSTYIHPELMQEIYPELKIPKPKGRMPGSKKKA